MGSKKIKYTSDEYKEYIRQNTKLEVLEDYKGIFTPIKHKCTICDYIFDRLPSTKIKGSGCAKCHHKSMTKNDNDYIRQLPVNIISLEPYVSSKKKILHKNTICGHEWMAKPNDILQGYGCQKCRNGIYGSIHHYNNLLFRSKLELSCYIFIEKNYDIDKVEFQKRYIVDRNYTCDFYFKDVDTWVEVSSINDDWYNDKIEFKKSLVKNFKFITNEKDFGEYVCTLV